MSSTEYQKKVCAIAVTGGENSQIVMASGKGRARRGTCDLGLCEWFVDRKFVDDNKERTLVRTWDRESGKWANDIQ